MGENIAAAATAIIERAAFVVAMMAIAITAVFVAADPVAALDYVGAVPVAAVDALAEAIRAVWAFVVDCARFPFELFGLI